MQNCEFEVMVEFAGLADTVDTFKSIGDNEDKIAL